MKNVIPLIILFGALLPVTSFASHAMGGDITYRCLGNNQYEITFTFYRDCNGIPAPSIMDIQISDGIGGASTTVTLPSTVTSPSQIHTVCPSASTTCNGGTYMGIEKWIYQGVITLTGTSANWIVRHSENARNAAITTIAGSGFDNLYVYAVINNLNGRCNNSPVFTGEPVPIICQGNAFCFAQSVYDVEGDSITYQLITPRTGPALSDTVSYNSGYSATQPVISSPPVTFNQSTGEMCMLPTQPDVSPFAVLVSQYDGGVLIGQIERDVQISVMACTNNLPACSGINGIVLNNNLSVCASLPNCFFITSNDQDVTNTTILSWDNSIAGMNATHTFGFRDTIFFCWTPSDSDTINSPRCFTATVTDDNCPYFGIQSSTYCLSVSASQICNPNSIQSPGKIESEIKIYPQPSGGYFNIQVGKNILKSENYLLLKNILGETIYRTLINDQLMAININRLIPDGVYFAYVTDAGETIIWVDKLIFLH